MFLGYPEEFKPYRLWCLETGHKRCIISRYVVFNEAEIAFKKTDDVGRSTKISEEKLEQEDVFVEVEHVDVELHNQMKSKKNQKLLSNMRRLIMTTWWQETGR